MEIKPGYIQFDESDAVLAKEYTKEEFNRLLKDTERSFQKTIQEDKPCQKNKTK